MRKVLASLLVLGATTTGLGVTASGVAGASTDGSTLSGEGGTFLQPVITKLVGDASSNLDGLYGSYVATGLDPGIADFIGTAPGAFNADFAVSERPLTTAEAATATTDGRPFAYVPIAATPVAIGTLAPSSSYDGSATINSAQLCPHIEMTVPDVGAVFGLDSADPVANWADSRFTCTNGQTISQTGVILAANDDPTMANYALMALMDSDPTAMGYFSAALTQDLPLNDATTSSTAPSEKWPYSGNAGTYVIAGGDQPFIGKLLTINASNNVPSNIAANWVLGATFPVSSVWTGAPLGAAWDIPTVALQNAAGAYVAPSTAAAKAAEADATLASTSDPTTNNLVTFNASTTDAAAYNNYMMEETYLVVPTTGLPANKDTALADFIRFALGPKGQTDIESFGAAPATSAMDAAGLKVAAALDAQAALSSSSTTATTTASSTASGGSTTTTSASGSTGGVASSSDGGVGGTSGSSGTSGSGLAFTGAGAVVPTAVVGAVLVMLGVLGRRKFRRRVAKP